MHFRFCGGLDCPDWLLAEMVTLSRLSSIKTRLLAGRVAKTLAFIHPLSKSIDDGKTDDQQLDMAKVSALTADAKFEPADVKATVAAIRFILSSAAKHSTEPAILESELQQLGLPREHSVALTKCYADNKTVLVNGLRSRSLRLSRLLSLTWRVDVVAGSSIRGDVGDDSNMLDKPLLEPVVQLCIRKSPSWNPAAIEEKHVSLTAQTFRLLLNDLKTARKIMDGL